MKLVFALVMMSTALGGGTLANAFGPGRVLMPDPAVIGPKADQTADPKPTLVDDDGDEDEDDEDDDENEDGWLWSSGSGDDDDDDDCEADDSEDDCTPRTTGNAAKAGTVAPPRNGLFTDGTAPAVTLN